MIINIICYIEGKKQNQFTISKKANIIEYTPDMFNKLIGMGNKSK